MNKFIPIFELLLADLIADFLGWVGMPLAIVGIHLTYEKDTAAHIATIAVGFLLLAIQRASSMKTIVDAHASPIALPAPNLNVGIIPGSIQKTVAILGLISISLFGVTGCTTVMPAQFENANPPLSVSDQKIVLGLASFDSPEALLGIRTSAGTITSVTMYELIKQTSTMNRDGLALNGIGKELIAFTAGSVGDIGDVDHILVGLDADASTKQSIDNFSSIGTGISGALAAAKTYVTNAATKTTNPAIAAYGLTVLCDDVHAAGEGMCDVTSQYVPVTATLTFRIAPVHHDYLALYQ